MDKIFNKKIIFSVSLFITVITVCIAGSAVIVNAQGNSSFNKFLQEGKYKKIATHMPLHRDPEDLNEGEAGSGTSDNRSSTMTGTGEKEAENFGTGSTQGEVGSGTSGNRAEIMTGTGQKDAEAFQKEREVTPDTEETGFSSGGEPGDTTSGGREGEFVPLQEIPGVIDAKTAKDPSLFFNAMFKFGIIIAGFLAVIMIAVGGIQYMSTDAIQGKGEGRERITYALMGLLLILFSYILLKTINPDILSFNLF